MDLYNPQNEMIGDLETKRSKPKTKRTSWGTPFFLKKSLVFVWWNGRKFILLHRNQASIVSNDGEIRKRERYKARARNRFRIVICLNFDSRPTYIVGRSFYILCSVLPISPLFRTFANESLLIVGLFYHAPSCDMHEGIFLFIILYWCMAFHPPRGNDLVVFVPKSSQKPRKRRKSKVILTFSSFFLAYIKLTLYLCSVIIKQTLLLTLQN